MRVSSKNIFMKAVSAAISLQMVCAVTPQLSTAVFAEADYYLYEDFSKGFGKWTNADNAKVMTDEETEYMRYSSDASSSVATRSLDNAISKGADIYIAEFDVRFEDGNSGVVELYGGTKLGPTIIFDGSKIKTKTGNPSTYVTMYDNAQAGKWYNVKFIADGTNSMYGYTTNTETDGSVQKTSKDVKRNLSSTQLTKINVTNKVNSETTVRSGAVDVRNLKVYKALPDKVEIDGDAAEISVPQTEAASSAKFTVGGAYLGDIDMTDYDLLGQGVLSFKLYDKNNKNEVSPDGISVNDRTGTLSVTSAASGSEGVYTVRLTNYDDSAYASMQIEVVSMGEAASIALTTAPTRIGVPNAGTAKTNYGATVKDEYGSEMGGVALKWSIVDENGNDISDEKLTIDDSGVVTAYAGAQTGSVRIKAESTANPEIYALSDKIEVYQMTAKTIEIIGDNYFAVPNSGSETKTYTTQIFDQYGVEMPAEEEKIWTVDNGSVSVVNGVLTVNAGTSDSKVTITVTSGGVSTQKIVTVYNPVLSTIAVEGDRSIEIPARGTKNFTYTAKSYDQYDFEIDCNGYIWGMTTDDNTALSMSGATVTVGANAKEQKISVSASSGNVSGTLRVVVTENPFTYKPVDGGFEIDNGKKNYTRPIYAPHINDDGNSSNRFIYYLGDRPKLVLSNASTSNFRRYYNMFLGIEGGKWLDEMSAITLATHTDMRSML